MGTVYEAETTNPQRRVALKVIRRDFISPDLARRFARESEVLGRLQHPGIAQVFEAGTAEGPNGEQSYFAMELVRGEPLIEFANNRTLDLRERLELFARVCDAVHYAHRQGVIHRDLKPANILVDDEGQPKVLDFGVARLTNVDHLESRQTSVGEMVGTLQYMSPEQVNADPEQVDARSDVYSLGVMLYELVSGRLPYALDRTLLHEAARVILVQDPAPLSSFDRKFRGDVEIIVTKSLEKEKARRYSSADALGSDVRRFLRDEPIIARPASPWYQLVKFSRRNRALVIGVSAVTAVVAIALTVGLLTSRAEAVRLAEAVNAAQLARADAEAAQSLAELRRAQADSALLVADSARALALTEQQAAESSAGLATREAGKALAVTTFLQDMLSSADPAVALGRELTVREMLESAAQGIDGPALRGQPEARASLEATIGRTYMQLGYFEPAATLLDSSYRRYVRTIGSSRTAADVAADIGKAARAAGDYPRAEQRLVEALALMKRYRAPDDDFVTAAMMELADVYYRQSRLAEAEALFLESLRLSERRHPQGGASVAEKLSRTGAFYTFIGRPRDGLPLLQRAVTMAEATFGLEHPRTIDVMVLLSDAQVNLPDHADAEATLRRILPAARTLYGTAHPALANVLNRLGTAISIQGRLEEASPLLRESLDMRIAVLGADHPDVQLARVSLGRQLQTRGRLVEAESLLVAAHDARRRVLGEQSPATASSLNDLGMLASAREDWADAEQRYRTAVPIWRGAGIEDQALFAEALLGNILSRQRKLESADSLLRLVVAARISLNGAQHWTVGDAQEKLAFVRLQQGDLTAADTLVANGLAIRRAVYGPRSVQVAVQLPSVANVREERGDTASGIPLLRESLALLAELQRPAADPTVVNTRRQLGLALCSTGATIEGEQLARAAVEQLAPTVPAIVQHRARAGLGYCLQRLARHSDAEPLLLDAARGFESIAAPLGGLRLETVARWLEQLYEASGRTDEAAVWRGRRK